MPHIKRRRAIENTRQQLAAREGGAAPADIEEAPPAPKTKRKARGGK